MTAALDRLGALQAWVGRQTDMDDAMSVFPAAALAATLDREEQFRPTDPLPPLWHWVYCLDLHRCEELAPNGHVRHGGFLPPMPYPRRMFAGARLRFIAPLRLGQPARRTASVLGIEHKDGRSGPLAFVRLRQTISSGGVLAVEEIQDIVYREAVAAPVPAVAAGERAAPVWVREVRADEVCLFRYSALIFNAHRIHWDRPYACDVEGYPGLVVHGQLVATWLADLLRRHTDRFMSEFQFRAEQALFAGQRCRLCAIPRGERVALWAEGPDGAIVMQARATLT